MKGKRWFLLGVGLLMVMLWSVDANAYCWWKNEYFHVSTIDGQGANDLFKVFYGPMIVLHTYSTFWGPADAVIYYNCGGKQFTIVKWSGGMVADCNWGWFCVRAVGPPLRARPICALWTRNNVVVGWTGPILWQWPYLLNGEVTLMLENQWHHWIGDDYPPECPGDGKGGYVGGISPELVQYAVVTDTFALDQLNETLYTSLAWTDITDVVSQYENIANDSSIPAILGDVRQGDVVVVRMTLSGKEGTDGEGLTSEELFQFEYDHLQERETQVPVLTPVGLVILALLLMSAGTILFLRRRHRIVEA
jgi:hypothetical protein